MIRTETIIVNRIRRVSAFGIRRAICLPIAGAAGTGSGPARIAAPRIILLGNFSGQIGSILYHG